MIQKQIDRLKYTFTKGNKPNATDIEALNGIIKYVNSEKERELNNNHLFAKLFLSDFKNDFIKNEGNYQYNIDSLRMILKKPLETHYEDVFNEMNEIEYVKFAKSKGLTFIHPALCDDEDREKQSELLKIHEKELIQHFAHFKKDEVYKRLNGLLNNIIEDYDRNR
jgi:hypothetical protein